MPRLQDIERFKRDLAGLSREAEVLSSWGEQPEEIAPPEGASDAAAEAAEKGRPAQGAAHRPPPQARAAGPLPGADEQPEEGLPPDFATLLADLPLEAPSVDAEPLAAEPFATATEDNVEELAPFEDIEGATPFEDTEAAPPLEDMDLGDFSIPSPTKPSFEEAEEPQAEAPAGAEDFSIPGLSEELPSFEASPEAPLETPEEAFSIPELSDSSLSFEEQTGAPAEPPAEVLSEEPEAPAGQEAAPETPPDEFSIPDLGDFGFEPSPEAGAELPSLGPAEAAAPSEIPESPASAEKTTTASAPTEEVDLGSFDLGTEGGDAFDSFSLGGATGGEDFDKELESLGEEAAPATTFNLDKEWETGFEIPGAESVKPARPKAAPRQAPQEKTREVSLTEGQVDRLQDRLLALPLNLRVAIENIVASGEGSEAQRSKLVWMLVEGAAMTEVAAVTGKILGKRISVPEGYEKRTGAAFEAEKGSLPYIFVHTVLPILKTSLLVLVAAVALGFLGWHYIYRPLAATALYRSGYARIGEDRYAEAEDSFARASSIKDYKSWYYRYAEAYIKKRQFQAAEQKYEALLKKYPKEAKAALDWAGLEKDRAKYQEAIGVLKNRILNYDYFNKDALSLMGEVYLDWADEDPKYYEEARKGFAALIQRYGYRDEFLEGMLLYFIRTDNLKEVKPLLVHFMAVAKPFPKASTLAELGGYLLDKGPIEDVHAVLSAAVAKDPKVPEVHYQLARYFKQISTPSEELKALNNAVNGFSRLPLLSRRQLGQYLDSLIWRGNRKAANKEFVSAEEDYASAAAEYDAAIALHRLQPSARFGEAYAGLAEVSFWQRNDLSRALSLYERAAQDGYDTPDTRYRRGYILYQAGSYPEALEQFYMAGREGDESPYLLFAFGDALYAREDYYAAQNYFQRTVDAMKIELDNIDNPSPQEKPSQGEIVELLMEAQNNLGATIYRVANRLGDASLRAKGMAAFSESARLFDSLTRGETTLLRSDSKNLSFLNMDYVLHPQRGIDLAVYPSIQRDMKFPQKK
jgi:tetratricopeptide (TPR) repeat protein